MSEISVRKNFVFKENIAKHLEEIALKESKSMTKVLEELIEQKYEETNKEKRLQALNDFFDITEKLIKPNTTIQNTKASMDKKYV
ncbi:MAG: hypothetical protein JXQ76_06645 [Campylobacterales bacterium]|nr:hypothetical protein [Campylobacterales bacterium]